jgi:hypothetical protein
MSTKVNNQYSLATANAHQLDGSNAGSLASLANLC